MLLKTTLNRIQKHQGFVYGAVRADWISDEVAKRIEALVDEARTKQLQVEVLSLT